MSPSDAPTFVKRKLGRPPKDPAALRTERVDVFFSVSERLKLSADATACGMSPAAYVRKLIAGHRPSAQTDRGADPRLLLELNAIGNNVQQACGLMQQGTTAKAEWRQLRRLLEETLTEAALEVVSVSPRLLLQLNGVGTQLNRAVADFHAGSNRRHDWPQLCRSLESLLLEVRQSDVH